MKKLTFEVEQANVEDNDPTSQFATAKILAFSSGYSRNKTFATPENLRKTAPSIYEKPIIFELSPYSNDFGTHSNRTVPAGFVVPNSAEFIQMNDGRLGLQVLAKIWKRYSGKFMEIFEKKKDKKSKVSVEMELLDERELEDNNIELLDWVYAAVTMLGEDITEGLPGANIEMVSFAAKEQKEYQRVYDLEFSRYDSIDFTIPEDVKEIAKMALENKKTSNAVSLAAGRYLLKNQKANPEKMKHIYKNILRAKNRNDKDSYDLFGGNIGEKWSQEIMTQMEKLDNERMSFFEKNNGEKTDSSSDFEYIKKEVNQSMENEDEKEDVKMEQVDEPKKEEMAEAPKEEPENEKEEETTPKGEGENKEPEEKKFSLDAYLDVAATLEFLEEETETFGEMLSEDEEMQMACKMAVDDMKEKREFADGEKVFKALFAKGKIFKSYAKMCKMQVEKFAKENEELRKFKEDIEKEQMKYQVDVTMKEVEKDMPKEEYEAAVEDSKNFSLENISVWKNKVFAKAFTYSKNNKSEKRDTLVYSLGWDDKKEKKNGWDW